MIKLSRTYERKRNLKFVQISCRRSKFSKHTTEWEADYLGGPEAIPSLTTTASAGNISPSCLSLPAFQPFFPNSLTAAAGIGIETRQRRERGQRETERQESLKSWLARHLPTGPDGSLSWSLLFTPAAGEIAQKRSDLAWNDDTGQIKSIVFPKETDSSKILESIYEKPIEIIFSSNYSDSEFLKAFYVWSNESRLNRLSVLEIPDEWVVWFNTAWKTTVEKSPTNANSVKNIHWICIHWS